MKMRQTYNIKSVFFFVCIILMGINGFSQSAEEKQDAAENNRPNIVYILADDVGYGDLGIYGQEKIETPNLDTLGQNGMIFTQHYAEPVCAPSRYALMTGKNAGHAYIRGNDEWEERGDVWNYKKVEANPALEGQLPIPDSTQTIAKILQKAGYKTGMVGKWGLGGPFSTGLPNNQGFDYFFGFLGQREDHSYYPGHLWENNKRVPLNNKPNRPDVTFPDSLDPKDPNNYQQYQQEDYAPDYIIEAALRFIRNNKSEPFFLYYPTPLPHTSLQAPERWVDYYLDKFGTDEEPYLGGSYFPTRYPHATRAAMISLLDEYVGKIIEELKNLDIYDNTIIMFLGDNGATFEAGSDPEWFNSGGPFKSGKGWGKGSVHEGGIREPFIVSWPDKIEPDSKSDLLSAEWDFLPTITELLDLPSPSNTQGISFLPTLFGQNDQQEEHPYLYWEFPGYGGQQAVRLGKWKGMIENMQDGNTDIQLYDLDKDPQEQNDVADKNSDIVKKIKQIMEREHTFPKVKSFRMEVLDGEKEGRKN